MDTWTMFMNMMVHEKVPHALLLVSAHHDDHYSLAVRFAHALLCVAPISEGACGQCRMCVLIKHGTHPDLRILGNQDENCGIDDIRALTLSLSQTSFQAGKKVVILHGVDKLLPAAANALLKTLEEPLGDVVFLLTATRSALIMPTLLSRCFKISLGKESQKSQEIPAGYEDFLIQINEKVLKEDMQQFCAKAPQQALYLFYYFVSELIRMHCALAPEYVYTSKVGDIMKNWKGRLSSEHLFGLLDRTTQAFQTISQPGINKGLLFESLHYTLHA
jgi:DNA polymerase III subunit delta'